MGVIIAPGNDISAFRGEARLERVPNVVIDLAALSYASQIAPARPRLPHYVLKMAKTTEARGDRPTISRKTESRRGGVSLLHAPYSSGSEKCKWKVFWAGASRLSAVLLFPAGRRTLARRLRRLSLFCCAFAFVVGLISFFAFFTGASRARGGFVVCCVSLFRSDRSFKLTTFRMRAANVSNSSKCPPPIRRF